MCEFTFFSWNIVLCLSAVPKSIHFNPVATFCLSSIPEFNSSVKSVCFLFLCKEQSFLTAVRGKVLNTFSVKDTQKIFQNLISRAFGHNLLISKLHFPPNLTEV